MKPRLHHTPSSYYSSIATESRDIALFAFPAAARAEAMAALDTLEAALSDGREVLVPPSYGPADVVWTAFIARIRFAGEAAELDRRPALARYAGAMTSRPSFRAADLWTRIKPLGFLRQIL